METLKRLRLLFPGVLVLVFWSILGRFTGDWSVTLPKTWADAASLSSVLVPAALYYTTPFRDWANKSYFADVTENLRNGLILSANMETNRGILTWQRLRPIFWFFVDKDASLKVKAKIAYNNGFFWTSAADLRSISFFYCIFSIGYFLLLDSLEAGVAAFFFAFVGIASIPISVILTKRHKKIGDEQIEIINQFHRDELVGQMRKIVAEPNS